MTKSGVVSTTPDLNQSNRFSQLPPNHIQRTQKNQVTFKLWNVLRVAFFTAPIISSRDSYENRAFNSTYVRWIDLVWLRYSLNKDLKLYRCTGMGYMGLSEHLCLFAKHGRIKVSPTNVFFALPSLWSWRTNYGFWNSTRFGVRRVIEWVVCLVNYCLYWNNSQFSLALGCREN